MTNNIEKLYELAGVEKELVCNCSSENLRTCKATKKYCCYSEFEYTFTDTKQLEIIKWFGKNFDIFRYWINDSEYIVEINGIFGNNKDFSYALADLVCELWNDLTDEQREEIKEILK